MSKRVLRDRNVESQQVRGLRENLLGINPAAIPYSICTFFVLSIPKGKTGRNFGKCMIMV